MPEVNTKSPAIVRAREVLGDKLRQKRIALGYSQVEIAETGLIDRTVLSRIEGGKRSYSVDYLLVLDELYAKLEQAKKQRQNGN